MLIKKSIIKLEKQFKIKFPGLNASFYISRGNMCVHMGLHKAIFGYSNFQDIINEIKDFFDTHLAGKFIVNFPQLIYSPKCKFDCLIPRKKRNE